MRIFVSKLLSGKGLGEKRLVRKTMEFLIRVLNPIKVLGHRMYLNPKDDSLGLFTKGSYELPVVDILEKHIKKGDVVLDIGANIGYHTLIMARLVGRTGKVFAFEPDPINAEYLLKNAKLNGYQNIAIIQKGVSNKTGQGRLYQGNSSSLHTIWDQGKMRYKEIEIITIDDYLAGQKADFAKIDVEGAEALAVEGMKGTVKSNPDITQIDNKNWFFQKK